MTLTIPRPIFVRALGATMLFIPDGFAVMAGIGLVGLSVYMED